MNLEDILTGSLKSSELPLVDGTLCAAADQVSIVGRPCKTPHLPIVAPAHAYGIMSLTPCRAELTLDRVTSRATSVLFVPPDMHILTMLAGRLISFC